MNIRKLIIYALGTCLSLILLLGGTGIYELNTSITKCVQIVDTDSRLVEYAHRVRADINIMRRFEKDAFLSVGDPAKVEEYRTKWVGVYERAKNCLEVLQKLESEPKHKQKVIDTSKKIEEYKTIFLEVIAQIKNGTITSSENAIKAIQSGKGSIHQAEDMIEAVAVENDKNISAAKGAIDADTHQATIFFVFITAVCLIIVLLGGRKLIRFIDQLQADQLKLLHAVEQSPITIVLTDINGNIEYVNPYFTTLTGYSAKEVVGQNPRILQSGETPPEIYNSMFKFFDLYKMSLSRIIALGKNCL